MTTNAARRLLIAVAIGAAAALGPTWSQLETSPAPPPSAPSAPAATTIPARDSSVSRPSRTPAEPDPSRLAPSAPAPDPTPAQELTGLATWYRARPGAAAAGPALRAWLGAGWRGATVTVCSGGRCLEARLLDWCACGDRRGQPTLIDLPLEDFAALARPSLGVIEIRIHR